MSRGPHDDDAAQPNVTVEIDAPVTIVMEEGDSLYFDPRISHCQVALDGPATFLTVINEQATAYGNATILNPKRDREHEFKNL